MNVLIASPSLSAEHNDAVTVITQAGETPVDNCGYRRGHFWLICGRPVGTAAVITTRPEILHISSTPRPQPEAASDLRVRGLSTVSTGANNPMEPVVSSQSTKFCGGPTWGQPLFQALPAALPTPHGQDVSGCSQTKMKHLMATRPNRLLAPGGRASHPSVAGSAWHTAESGGTQR
jgi:hypothetical protein